MPTIYKWTFVINCLNQKTGWTESYALDLSDYNSFKEMEDYARNGALKRMAICGKDCEMDEIRYQILDGKSRPVAIDLVPFIASKYAADPYRQSCLLRCGSNNGATRKVFLKSIPDSFVSAGKITPDPDFQRKIDEFKTFLSSNVKIKTFDRDQPKIDIVGVSALGVMVTDGQHGLAAGDRVTLFRNRDVNGRVVTGSFKVSSVADNHTATLYDWFPARATVGGKMQKKTAVYEGIGKIQQDSDVHYKRGGRPFGLEVGRSSSPNSILRLS